MGPNKGAAGAATTEATHVNVFAKVNKDDDDIIVGSTKSLKQMKFRQHNKNPVR